MRRDTNGQPKNLYRLTMHFFQSKDLQYHWHPCSNMKNLELTPPFVIKSARGSYIEGVEGHRIIDGISSWWCKSLGHNHPRLKKALISQIDKFEHVITATTTYDKLANLSEVLVGLIPGMGKVFYAGDGSSAVEVALKMSLHSRLNQGNRIKKKFASLKNGYHGETCGALSVSQVNQFKNVYDSMVFSCLSIEDIPYINTPQDFLWENCDKYWNKTEQFLQKHHHELTALIVEPILQGAGGMRLYSQDFLRRLSNWSKEYDVHLIADEIMTGLGRTGKMFACDYAQIAPDFMCLSKGLTSGWVSFSAILTSNEIYQNFYNSSKPKHEFYHSHTYSGNALGTCLALETLKIFTEDFDWGLLNRKADYLFKSFQEIVEESKTFSNIRGIGMVVAADIKENLFSNERIKEMIHRAFQKGALLRPLGKTLYWLPPLTVEKETIDELKEITKQAVLETFTH